VTLTLLKLFGNGIGDPVYYAFLPMCFFGVAELQLSLLKRMNAMESELTIGSKNDDCS
jgi:hypothetical protein